ncbi:hypothetical protein [Nitrosophilus labii]|uniref:hypothetical protein n=1 Tax=Nitrosophilus labii TaxID=2706014 RepID=UPI00165715C9|nr:hypothetical protein [Nitrosophilus labii]
MIEFIYSLEEKIKEQEPRKRVFILLIILFLVLFTIYFFLIEPIIEEINQKQETLAALEQKISKNSPKKMQSKIFLKKKEIFKNENLKEELNLKLLLLKSRFDKIRFLFVNDKDFNRFLNSLLKESVNKNILIKDIKILDKEEPFIGKLYVKKAISVEGKGRFLNIISFVRGLESNKMLMSIKELIIETEGSLPKFSFNIDFYGVRK